MRLLVFGAGGQLGRTLLAEAPAGHEVIGLTHAEADIADAAAVREAIARVAPSVVVNAAAYTSVDEAEDAREEARRVNVEGAATLAWACAREGLPLIHVSTDYVFDGAKGGAYVEGDRVGPLNHYGATKWAGEEAVRDALERHLILRTSWLYGPYGRNFASRMIALAAEREVIQAVTDQRASPTSASDLAAGIAIAATAIEAGRASFGTFHVAGSGSASRYELAEAIVEAQARFTGRRPKLEPAWSANFPARATRPADTTLDSGRFATAYGFHAEAWRPAVERFVARSFGAEVGRSRSTL